MAKQKTWEKEMVIDGIEFKLTFWKDSWGSLWTSIEKKIIVRGWFGKQYEAYELIRKYWTEKDPVELAKQEIADYIEEVKNEIKNEKVLDNWCK